jgi:hypothetical protein
MRAVNLEMENEREVPYSPDDPWFLRARAISLSVAAIRRARGVLNPSDFPVGSTEWHAAMKDFAGDVLRALGNGFPDFQLDFDVGKRAAND